MALQAVRNNVTSNGSLFSPPEFNRYMEHRADTVSFSLAWGFLFSLYVVTTFLSHAASSLATAACHRLRRCIFPRFDVVAPPCPTPRSKARFLTSTVTSLPFLREPPAHQWPCLRRPPPSSLPAARSCHRSRRHQSST